MYHKQNLTNYPLLEALKIIKDTHKDSYLDALKLASRFALELKMDHLSKLMFIDAYVAGVLMERHYEDHKGGL